MYSDKSGIKKINTDNFASVHLILKTLNNNMSKVVSNNDSKAFRNIVHF